MFKYGERIWYYWTSRWKKKPTFDFRKSPVPYTGLHGFSFWYKRPSMRKRERSLWYEHKAFVRPARQPNHMPDPWNDEERADIRSRKSWKNKKIRKQWMKNNK